MKKICSFATLIFLNGPENPFRTACTFLYIILCTNEHFFKFVMKYATVNNYIIIFTPRQTYLKYTESFFSIFEKVVF